MNNGKSASCTLKSTGTGEFSESDALLSQLLPHLEDATAVFDHVGQDSIAYKDIHRVRLNNGVRAVRLPDGMLLAKSLDRKAGRAYWVKVRA